LAPHTNARRARWAALPSRARRARERGAFAGESVTRIADAGRRRPVASTAGRTLEALRFAYRTEVAWFAS